MNRSRLALFSSAFLLLGGSALGAQTLEEVCPNSEEGTGALWGLLSDLDSEMGLPGATVRATWEVDGTPGSAEVQTGFDGGFTMCYLPLGTEIMVQGVFANMGGQAVPVTLTEPITRQDVGFSLSGAGGAGEEDDRIWGCIGQEGSQMRQQMSSLLRCEAYWPDLERCPKQELGRVSGSATGTLSRGSMREAVERLLVEARRMGANALIRFEGRRGTVNAMAVLIEVDPTSC